MTSWYIIDDRGARAVPQSPPVDLDDWPSFALLSICALSQHDKQTLYDLLEETEEEASSARSRMYPLYVHEHDTSWTCVMERGDDPDAWTLHPVRCAALSQRLHAPLSYLSHDRLRGAIHLDLFDAHGAHWLRWQDALDPSLPCDVELYMGDECTVEDARAYALRMLDLSPTTPTLDRHAFVAKMLARHGLCEPLALIEELLRLARAT